MFEFRTADHQVGLGGRADVDDAVEDVSPGIGLRRVGFTQEFLSPNDLFLTAGGRSESHLLVGQLLHRRQLKVVHDCSPVGKSPAAVGPPDRIPDDTRLSNESEKDRMGSGLT